MSIRIELRFTPAARSMTSRVCLWKLNSSNLDAFTKMCNSAQNDAIGLSEIAM